jgi:N-acetylmuramoyl-L-alanine amidase
MRTLRVIPVVSLRRLLICAILALCAVATSASAALRVTVKPGDTLGGIAARHGVTTTSLARFNGISTAGVLSIGRSLAVPWSMGGVNASRMGSTSRSYTVRPGDTLSGISVRFGVSVGSIVRQNGLSSKHLVIAGTRLRVGSGSGTRPAIWVGASSGYTVKTGDNLSSIAARFGTSARALARANGIANPNVVIVGTRLRVTGGGEGGASAGSTSGMVGGYTVRSGDNLSSIAARFGTSARALARANGIANSNVVMAGAQLRVPGSSSTPSSGPLTPITAAGSGWGSQPSKSTVASLMAAHAARRGVDLSLVRAVAWQESGWWQGARSSSGAIGVMQLMPGTVSWIGPALLGRSVNPYNASDNIEAGVAYLGYLQRQTGSRRLAIASYYQGLGSVTTRGLLAETEAYVASVASFIGRV